MSRPVLAADPAAAGPRRSLVLAGGGMRVAYQAGVLAALDEAGLRFHHIDGTSGGTMNLSMLLTGQPVEEMCDRWRDLQPRRFASPLALRDYLCSPHWPGLGSGRGIREQVFPALGIDAEQVRKAEGVSGTYNVANFATKTAEVFDHSGVDEDLLVAAISLPVLMPAVQRQGTAYTDAVWIRDSNVPEAVRQGSRDVWLVWCIGNTAEYRPGSFRQYVHMIEMAATGSLMGDLDHLATDPAASGLRLHVIKPSRPIPLDPDYFLGRVDGASLIGMGYRDACAYLARPQPFTLPCGPEVTAMARAEPALSARLTLAGSFTWPGRAGSGPAELHLRLEAAQVDAERAGPLAMDAVGDVSLPGWAARRPVERGTAHLAPAGGLELDLAMSAGGEHYRLSGSSRSGGRLVLTLHSGAAGGAEIGSGSVGFGRAEAARLAAGIHLADTASVTAGWRARWAAAQRMWRAGGE